MDEGTLLQTPPLAGGLQAQRVAQCMQELLPEFTLRYHLRILLCAAQVQESLVEGALES